MEYFSKFLRAGIPQLPKSSHDHVQEFNRSWQLIKNTLQFPDERQLTRGITATDVPAHLKLMVDSLVWESTRTEEGTTGQCLEYLLKNDVLGNLVRLSEMDRPFGIQAQVLRSVANMVVLLDEQFLVHSAVHKAVLRLLRGCVGDQIEEQVDGKIKPMGAASNAARSTPSEYEEDLVDLLCILCSRIRNYRELLMIFFHDKHWFQSDLQTVSEEDEDVEDEDGTDETPDDPSSQRAPSPTPSQNTITSVHTSSAPKKTEYEFLLFNYLLRFVHREGRIGDFARAGLLFLMDVAMSASDTTQHRLLEENDSVPASPDSDTGAADPVANAALALAEYVLDGDFSDVLGAGLGAVYSLLPSKLDVRPDIDHTSQGGNNGMTLGAAVFGTEEEKQRLEFERERNLALGLESSTTPEFKARLDHFLKLVEFLQDVLRRNGLSESQSQLAPSALVGTAITQSILDAVQSVFLENILYTSILECSDTDGSGVAVMSYIDIMIRTVAGSQLGELLVNFLMSEDDHDSRRPHPRVMSLDRNKKERERAKKIRRKSSAMVLLEMEVPDSRKQTDYFTSIGRFTLKDLIFYNLRSPYQPSVTAAMQLLQSLLIYHPMLCVDKLLMAMRDPDATNFPRPLRISESEFSSTPSPVSDDDDDVFIYPGEKVPTFPDLEFSSIFKEPDMTFLIHELEMDMYFNLISRMGPTQNDSSFSTGYDHYLNDALISIQSQSAFGDGVMTELSTSTFSMHHRLDPNDPLLGLILKSLRGFFSRSPESNIALTGVLAALASDPYRSLAGWLTFNIPKSEKRHGKIFSTNDILDDGDDRSVDFDVGDISVVDDIDLVAMPLNETLRPVLYSVLLGLVTQLDRYRAQVEDFDKYLVERRQGLLFSENLNDALNLALELVDDKFTAVRPTNSATVPAIPPTRPKPKANKSSSLVSFLTPKKKSATTSLIPTPHEPTTPPHRKVVAASPFGPHYQETGAIAIQPLVASLPASGPWSPAKKAVWSTADENVFTVGTPWEDEIGYTEPKKEIVAAVTKVTLSQLLDNVVILEESTKELMAIIQARRSLGIDSIRYM